MRILISARTYPTRKNQLTAFIAVLAEEMVRQGMEVTVLAPQSLTTCWRHKIPLCPPIYQVDVDTPAGIRKMTILRPISITLGQGRFYALSQKIDRWVKNWTARTLKSKPDVIYSHFWLAADQIIDYAIKHKIEVIVVDNLATLYHCPKPNDSENWRQYDKFILDCRRNGIATILIDHCGKNNDSGAAGSYAKQNIVNHCIQLDAEAAAGGEGARFWVNFQKSRSCYGTAILPMLLSVRDGKVRHVLRGDHAAEPDEPDDIPLIQTTEPTATKPTTASDEIREMIKNGMDNKEIVAANPDRYKLRTVQTVRKNFNEEQSKTNSKTKRKRR